LDYCRSSDVLMVTRLDGLARSIADLCKILAQLEAKGASLRVLNMNLDTATPTGKLILNCAWLDSPIRARANAGTAARGYRQGQG
jgi:DNA invertase Pin-like site-specific DNA recombinase